MKSQDPLLPPTLDFDPRQIPWSSHQGHWPAIDAAQLGASQLSACFASPPVWAPELIRELPMGQTATVQAAVLIPIVLRGPLGNAPHVLLTQRTEHLSTHAGQIAFPGGKVDAHDLSPEAAAVREAQEEVGLDPHYVRILGSLPHYVTGTAFVITPVVALVDPAFEPRPNPHEVADVFEVPLAFLMNPANHRFHEWLRDGVMRQWYSMPYTELADLGNGQQQAQERFIWGATAGMLRNFYRFLLAANSL